MQHMDVGGTGFHHQNIRFASSKIGFERPHIVFECLLVIVANCPVRCIQKHLRASLTIPHAHKSGLWQLVLRLIVDPATDYVVPLGSNAQRVIIPLSYEVAQYECDTFLLDHVVDIHKRNGQICFLARRFMIYQFADDPEDMLLAFFRRNEQLDFLGEQEQSYFIVILDGTECENCTQFCDEFMLETITCSIKA